MKILTVHHPMLIFVVEKYWLKVGKRSSQSSPSVMQLGGGGSVSIPIAGERIHDIRFTAWHLHYMYVHCAAFALYSRSTLNGVLASSPYPKNSASVCKQACAAPNCIFIALYLHCIAFAQLWGDLQGKKLTEASLSTPFRTAYYCLLEKTRARQYIFHGYPSEAMTKHVIDPLW